MSLTIKNLLFAALLAITSQIATADALRVNYVANAGVKLSSGDSSVLIDAIFPIHRMFKSLTDEEFNQLVQDGADIAMATHIHSDHFGAARSIEFLKANPDALFIGTPKMLDRMKGQANPSQIATETRADFVSTRVSHKDITVDILNFPHMQPELAQAVNFGYVVHLNGWKVLHIGDAAFDAEIIEHLKLAEWDIDLAILHDLVPSEQKNFRELFAKMNADKIAFVHMVDEKKDPFGNWLKTNMPDGEMLITGRESFVLER